MSWEEFLLKPLNIRPCLTSSTGTLLTCWMPSEERIDVALTWHCVGCAWPVQKSSWKQHHQDKLKNMWSTSGSSCSMSSFCMSCIYDCFMYSSAARTDWSSNKGWTFQVPPTVPNIMSVLFPPLYRLLLIAVAILSLYSVHLLLMTAKEGGQCF